MSLLLNRDTCFAHFRGNRRVTARFAQNAGSLHVSAATVMSLVLWLMRPTTPGRLFQSYQALGQLVTFLAVDQAIAERAGRIAGRLPPEHPRLSTIDLLVVATAVEHQLTLVTHATQRYSSIPGLTLADWTLP
jgi:predicted nucleic acid-binding protein